MNTDTPEIRLSGLEKSYPLNGSVVHAVRGIDVAVAAGETVALLGPNGAGKSTTIDMLLGLTSPDAGSISIFGRTPAEAVAAGAVGAVLQTGGLIRDLTVGELIAMFASLYPAPLEPDEVVALTGLGEIVDQRTQELSGGQTQRVRFALALEDAPAGELAGAIREIAAGRRALDPALAAAAITHGTSPLTAREHDVLAAASEHPTAAAIAGHLHLSEGTVRNYLSSAIRKLGARNRAEAVRIAESKGWL